MLTAVMVVLQGKAFVRKHCQPFYQECFSTLEDGIGTPGAVDSCVILYTFIPSVAQKLCNFSNPLGLIFWADNQCIGRVNDGNI